MGLAHDFSVEPEAPRVAGLILASGMSRRFGPENKLLAPLAGVVVVRRTVQAYCDAGLEQVLVVVGHDAERVQEALFGLDVIPVQNPDFALGQSRALVRGVRALPGTASAALIGVADQPLLSADALRQLVERYRSSRALLVVPRYAGQRGNPVLFDRRLFGELLAVTGDEGGRSVVIRHQEEISWLDVAEAWLGADLDTVEDLVRLGRTPKLL